MHLRYISRCQKIFVRNNHTDIRVHRLLNLKDESEKDNYTGNRRKNDTNNYYDFLLFNQDSSRYNISRSSVSNIEERQESPRLYKKRSEKVYNDKDNKAGDNGFSKNKENAKISMNRRELSKSSSIFDNIMRTPAITQPQQEANNNIATDKHSISRIGLDGDCSRVLEQVFDKKMEFIDCVENSYDVKHKHRFVAQRPGHIIPMTATKNLRTTVDILKEKKIQSIMNLIQFSDIDDKDAIDKYKQMESKKYENILQVFNSFEGRINSFLGKEYSLGSLNVIQKLIECLNNFLFKFIQKYEKEMSLTSDQLIILGKNTYDMSLSKFIIKYLGSTKTSRVYDFKNPSYYKLLDLSLINRANFNYDPDFGTNQKIIEISDEKSNVDNNYVNLFNSMCSQNETLIARFILTHNLASINSNSNINIENFQELQNFISGLKVSKRNEVHPMYKKINHIFNTITNENPDIFKERTNRIIRNIRKHKILTYRKIKNTLRLKKTRFRRIDVEIGNQAMLFIKNVVILRQLKKHSTKQLPVSYTKIFNFLNTFNDREVLNTLRNVEGKVNLIKSIENLYSTGQLFPLRKSSRKNKNQAHTKFLDGEQRDDADIKLKLRFKFYKSRRDYIYKYLKRYLDLCILNYNNFFFLMIGLVKMKYGDKKVERFIEFKILKGADGILMLSDRKLLN